MAVTPYTIRLAAAKVSVNVRADRIADFLSTYRPAVPAKGHADGSATFTWRRT